MKNLSDLLNQPIEKIRKDILLTYNKYYKQLHNDLDIMKPDKRWGVILSLLKFAVPTMMSQNVENNNNNNSINVQFANIAIDNKKSKSKKTIDIPSEEVEAIEEAKEEKIEFNLDIPSSETIDIKENSDLIESKKEEENSTDIE